MKMDKNEIVIKIEEGIQTKAFNVENIIHKDAFNRVVDLINQNLDKAKNYNPHNKEDLINNRIHNTITINGERGAGKTSFMLSIKKEYENSNEVEILGILDPTLISTKQHVFILLISMIEEKVYEKFNDKCRDKKYDNKFKEWKESLEELAKGLNQLDGVGSNPYAQDLWDDSALVMAKGLSMAKAGRDLEWKFHKFVYKSLDVLSKEENNKKSAFLLFIDDIDTDFSKGWDVLEVLRKYITTPQIIPIMAGNFELYENLVRNKKSKLFKNLVMLEKNFNSFENKKSLYNSQIDELTQQYLIKVMQPINMINLHKLYYYLFNQNKFQLLVQIPKKDNRDDKENYEEIPLIKFIEENIFNKYYRYFYKDNYFYNITNMPLRNIFQYLYYAIINNNENSQSQFFEYHKDLFLTYFTNLGINFDFFDLIKDYDKGIDYFVNKFQNIYSIDEVKKFIPVSSDFNKNQTLLLIPQYFNSFLDFRRYFEWGIKVVLQFYWMDLLNTKLKLENKISKKDVDLKLNLFVNLNERINYILKSIYNVGESFNIYIHTYRRKEVVNYNDENDENKELTYELIKSEILRNNIDEKFYLFILPYVAFKRRNETYDAFSVLYIFNELFNLMKFENVNEIKQYIIDFIKKRIMYENIINTVHSEYEPEEMEIIEIQNDFEVTISDEFCNDLLNWKNTILEKNTLHLLQINHIFYNYIDRIYKFVKPNSFCNIYEYLAVQVALFINEIIFKLTENYPNIVLKEIKSPDSIKDLCTNLSKIKKYGEQTNDEFLINAYQFVKKFIDFPLFNIFLKEFLSTSNCNDIQLNVNNERFEFLKNNLMKIIIQDGKCSEVPESIFKKRFKRVLEKCQNEKDCIQKEINNVLKTSNNEFRKLYKRKKPSINKLKSWIEEIYQEIKNENLNEN